MKSYTGYKKIAPMPQLAKNMPHPATEVVGDIKRCCDASVCLSHAPRAGTVHFKHLWLLHNTNGKLDAESRSHPVSAALWPPKVAETALTLPNRQYLHNEDRESYH